MKRHIIKFRAVDKINFDTILDGSKSVETRAATNKYRAFETGDILVIMCGNEKIEKPIKKIEHFDSIDSLVESVGLKNVMPLAKDLAEAKKAWYSFPGYKAKIAQYGLITFYI